MKFPKCLNKVILGWQDWRSQYKHYHHLSTVMSGSHQYMAEQTIARILIIRFDLKRFQKITNITDNRICTFIFNQTFIYRYNKMCSLLINSGNHSTILPMSEYCMYFISIMERIFHSNDLLCIAVWLQKFIYLLLLLFQLLLIWHIQKLTSTTFSMYRTK